MRAHGVAASQSRGSGSVRGAHMAGWLHVCCSCITRPRAIQSFAWKCCWYLAVIVTRPGEACCMRLVRSNIDFTTVLVICASASIHVGVVSQLAIDMIESNFAKADARAEAGQLEEDAFYQAEDMLMKGMTKEDLETLFRNSFMEVDVDETGSLTRTQSQKCLRDTDLGFSRKEINAMMAEADSNEDGVISYEEFMPVCQEILLEIVTQEVKNAAVPRDLLEVRNK